MVTDANLPASVILRLTNLLVLEAANTLIEASKVPGTPPNCAATGERLLAVLANRMASDGRKGNAKGGPGQPPKWYIVEDEQTGTVALRGMDAVAARFGIHAQAMRARLSSRGGKWSTTRQTDSGEWSVLVRRATPEEAERLSNPETETGTALA